MPPQEQGEQGAVTRGGDADPNKLRFVVRKVTRVNGFEIIDGSAQRGDQTVGKVRVKLEDSAAFGILESGETYQFVKVGR